jgi:hypothetical protein
MPSASTECASAKKDFAQKEWSVLISMNVQPEMLAVQMLGASTFPVFSNALATKALSENRPVNLATLLVKTWHVAHTLNVDQMEKVHFAYATKVTLLTLEIFLQCAWT